MGKVTDKALTRWLAQFPRATVRERLVLGQGFRAGWAAALDAVEAILPMGEMLMTADCIEDRHDDCVQKGSTDPTKVCGCPCHGQFTRKARR